MWYVSPLTFQDVYGQGEAKAKSYDTLSIPSIITFHLLPSSFFSNPSPFVLDRLMYLSIFKNVSVSNVLCHFFFWWQFWKVTSRIKFVHPSHHFVSLIISMQLKEPSLILIRSPRSLKIAISYHFFYPHGGGGVLGASVPPITFYIILFLRLVLRKNRKKIEKNQ